MVVELLLCCSSVFGRLASTSETVAIVEVSKPSRDSVNDRCEGALLVGSPASCVRGLQGDRILRFLNFPVKCLNQAVNSINTDLHTDFNKRLKKSYLKIVRTGL